jgi:SEC-C motif-containing protein
MRSRYTAFTLGTPAALAYLVATQHPDFRAPALGEELEATVASLDAWESLTILAASEDGDKGHVEFEAVYRQGGHCGSLHERSSFRREDGRWLYTTGEVA